MATKTPKYEFQKKEDNDFYNIEDFNANWDKVENALTEFDDSGTVEGITSFTDMLTKLVTGNKFAVTLRNLKAGLQVVLHAGSIVNNCVTDNAKLPLSAAQGKALQDAITKLNGDLDSTRNFFVFKTVSQKSTTAGTTGFWHEKIKIPVGYKVLYVSATYDNADNCMLTPYGSVIAGIGNTSDIEPWFGFYAARTGTGTFTTYAVCVKI